METYRFSYNLPGVVLRISPRWRANSAHQLCRWYHRSRPPSAAGSAQRPAHFAAASGSQPASAHSPTWSFRWRSSFSRGNEQGMGSRAHGTSSSDDNFVRSSTSLDGPSAPVLNFQLAVCGNVH